MSMAASVGAHPDLFHVEVLRAGGHWHRRVKIGAFGFWQPEGCPRQITEAIEETRADPPPDGAMCRPCWPVWPSTKRR